MMWSNFVRRAVILLQENWASTCANQISGSLGQKAGSLRLTMTAEMSAALAALAVLEASSVSASDVVSLVF